MLDKKARVKELRDLGSSNYLLSLISPEQGRMAQPGQFVMLKCAEEIDGLPLLRRPFSIFDVHPNPKTFRPGGIDLLVKDVGAGTRRLAQLRKGDDIFVLGPQGKPFHLSAEMRNRIGMACLVAGGVGIAALYLLARKLMEMGVKPFLFYGGRHIADLALREYFERLGLDVFYTTEDGSLGERGVVTAPLANFLRSRRSSNLRVYACGPWGMMKAVHELCVCQKVPCEVSLEARMGCSLGACMGCVVRGRDANGEMQYLRVCLEGPVMDSRVIDWEIVPL
jgi:dihydroorotate dehydrogenase electron transfer subunit